MTPGGRMALLVMDMQRGIVDRVEVPGLLPRLGHAIGAAREHDVAVIYVTVGFRPGHPEVSARNRMFSALRESGGAVAGEATQVHPAISPLPGEVVTTKRRVSAFAGSDLDVILRAQEITTLVLTGIATSGVVLSTLRAAADLDFALTVLRDGCADADAEVHRVLMDKVFPRQAEVLAVADWVARLGDGPSA
jgi:nicotinamidase-related amidase